MKVSKVSFDINKFGFRWPARRRWQVIRSRYHTWCRWSKWRDTKTAKQVLENLVSRQT